MERIEISASKKYPRTYHMPFSEGATNDDRICESEWWEHLKGKRLILTEKLDGESVMCCKTGAYTRSVAAPTEHPWSRNIWEHGGVYDNVKNILGEDEMIYGENLYGIHSIEYNNLVNDPTKISSYYYMFGARDSEKWYSWEDVCLMADILKLSTVPVLEIGKFDTVDELKERIMFHMAQGSKYGDTIEGVVVRNANEYPVGDFKWNVVKYVRKNHVQTDQFWHKNWKKANIIY